MGALLGLLGTLVGPGQLGGWVRAGVAGAIGLALAKWPLLSSILGPDVQNALAVVASGIVVGVWSTLTKTPTAAVAAVDALANDPTSPVKGVIVANTTAGQQLADSLPGNTTTVAGSSAARAMAGGT